MKMKIVKVRVKVKVKITGRDHVEYGGCSQKSYKSTKSGYIWTGFCRNKQTRKRIVWRSVQMCHMQHSLCPITMHNLNGFSQHTLERKIWDPELFYSAMAISRTRWRSLRRRCPTLQPQSSLQTDVKVRTYLILYQGKFDTPLYHRTTSCASFLRWVVISFVTFSRELGLMLPLWFQVSKYQYRRHQWNLAVRAHSRQDLSLMSSILMVGSTCISHMARILLDSAKVDLDQGMLSFMLF